jgi:hypothetical protein
MNGTGNGDGAMELYSKRRSVVAVKRETAWRIPDRHEPSVTGSNDHCSESVPILMGARSRGMASFRLSIVKILGRQGS